MIKCVLVNGYIPENTYFYVNDKTNHCFLIDPGYEGKRLLDIANKNNYIIDKIILTHGHFDHIGAISEIRKNIDVEVYAYIDSEKYLTNSYYNLSRFLGGEEVIINDVKYFRDGDIISLDDGLSVKVIYTPGHTEDSCVFYSEKDKVLFSGDTLFNNGIGNTSFPGGNYDTLISSIKNKILTLNDEVKVYPGHGDETSIRNEKINF